MKKSYAAAAFLFFFYLLCFPEYAVGAARDGLVLWYRSVLPVLLPFMLFSSAILRFELLEAVPSVFYQPICRLFGCSRYGAFAVFSGFLCGFPMGSKLTGDLLFQKKINRTEADFLYGFVNNLSPGFLLSYVAAEQLQDKSLGICILIPVLGSAVLYGIFSSYKFRIQNTAHTHNKCRQKTNIYQAADCTYHLSDSAPVRSISSNSSVFQILDDCIYDTVRNITKLGAYITLFCIISSAFSHLLPTGEFPILLSAASIEVTNGIRLIAESTLSFPVKYCSVIGLCSFGGFSALAQSAGISHMDRKQLFYYTKSRVFTTLLSILISLCMLYAF